MTAKKRVCIVFAFKSQKEFRDSTWANAAINVSSDPKGGGGGSKHQTSTIPSWDYFYGNKLQSFIWVYTSKLSILLTVQLFPALTSK